MKIKSNVIAQPHRNCPYCDKGEYPYTIPNDRLKCSHDGCIFLFPCSLYNKSRGRFASQKK